VVTPPANPISGSLGHRPTTRDDAETARRVFGGVVNRTPLVRADVGQDADIRLKLENLQPIGSFKIRGAASKMLRLPDDTLQEGVWTASAGNMAQGVAWCARHRGVNCTVVVPESAPDAKLLPVERLGAVIRKVSRETFFDTFARRELAGVDGMFIHAFSDADVMAGNGTIALEILEDLPDVQVIFVPYGGGGLSCGIAGVVRSIAPGVRVIACEPESAAPLAASFRSGAAVSINFIQSFVDGAGGPRVYPEMLDLALQVVDEAIAVPLADVAEAVRLLAVRCHVVAEGAGALALAAALRYPHDGPVACVVSGGNIDSEWLRTILDGRIPLL
jgi:threonine dehydratase